MICKCVDTEPLVTRRGQYFPPHTHTNTRTYRSTASASLMEWVYNISLSVCLFEKALVVEVIGGFHGLLWPWWWFLNDLGKTTHEIPVHLLRTLGKSLLWEPDTFIDTDHTCVTWNMENCYKMLREKIHNNPSSAQFIKEWKHWKT